MHDLAVPLGLLILVHTGMIAEPGPDFALVTRLSTRTDAAAGITAAIGIAVASLLLALSGIAVARPMLYLSSSTLAGLGLRLAGAGWLCWQAALLLWESKEVRDSGAGGLSSPFLQGFLSHAMNSEVLVFYAVLFSRIDSRSVGLGPQLVAALAMAGIAGIWFVLVAGLTRSHAVVSRLASSRPFRTALAIWLLWSAVWLVVP